MNAQLLEIENVLYGNIMKNGNNITIQSVNMYMNYRDKNNYVKLKLQTNGFL